MSQSALRVIAVVVVVAAFLANAGSTEAAVGAAGLPLLRGLPPDHIFTAGTPESTDIPLTFYYAPVDGACYDEVWAEATLPGVTIDSPCYGGGCGSSDTIRTIIGNLGGAGSSGF